VRFLNPVTPLILCYQDVLYWGRFPKPLNLAMAAGYGLLAVASGLIIFRRYRYLLAEEL